ncbi:MAG: ABC-2 family transporter protein [Planctomycetes bacterium]|nr:ABC-2 family transporter protein [Planctomycetota bacterium]
MHARVLTWWTILRIAIEERLVYRGDFALGTLMRFLPIITQIFLWSAIFDSLGESADAVARATTAAAGSASAPDIAGYSYYDMVAYYLITMIGRAFSSMPGLASGIALQIRNGEIKKFLIQPVDLLGFLLFQRIAHKLVYYLVAILPFALVYFLCRRFFTDGWPDGVTFAAFVAALLMGFLIGFFMEASIGLIGFWFLEVTSLLFVYMLLSFFLSGHMFPLDMLPQPWSSIVDVLPLKYLAYFPAAVFLGKIEGDALTQGLLIEAGWLVFFILLSRIMLWRGVKRYSGFGG